jgi:hypothetical protein
MPSNCWGKYRHVAVIETDGTVPSRIDSRPRHVKRIVSVDRNLNVGTTDRCAYARALAAAEQLAAELNAAC